ncbi:DEAD/DEAH box helicase [Bernardetia sp. ABR2-2B]|uniref:DEAD/DEAH box helicase n=1 Tax=Bernardetia sp. ABR2-2B TaxID=3127472 RepID=UPI0030CB35EA
MTNYYSERIGLIEHISAQMRRYGQDKDKATSQDYKALQYGFVSSFVRSEYDQFEELERYDKSVEPTQEELCSYGNFFNKYPNKTVDKKFLSTSFYFSVQSKATLTESIEMLKREIEKLKKTKSTPPISKVKMKMKAKALQLRRKRALALLKMESNGLSGLDGVLGSLGEVDKKEISKNKSRLASLIAKENTNKKLINSFDDNFKRYNKGITEGEIKAWVWYKQSQGSPMYGWEKYFLKATGKVEEVLVTTKATIIKDNHFRDEGTVPSDSILGKPSRFTNEYDKKVYQIYTDKEGNKKFVNKSHVKLQRTSATADPKELDKFVREGLLFFGEADLLPLPLFTFGNIYDKILALEKQKEHIIKEYGQSVYDDHVRVLNEAKPRPLSVLNPDASKRLKILPFSEFALKYKVEEDAEGNPVEEDLNEFFKTWLNVNANLIEVDGISARNIIHVYLEGGRKSKEEKEFLEKHTREEGDRLFDIFLNTGISINDQKRLDMSWNRQYNGFAKLNYKRIPIGLATCALFKGMPLAFMEAQREAIAFIDAVGSGCLAYDVGVGKTMAAILIAAQNIQNGTYKRPVIVVPKPTYQKWINEIVGYTDKEGNFIEGILSHLDIKINSLGNMGKRYINPKTVNKQLEEGSISIITYEGFAKIGFSEQLEVELFDSLAKILLHVDADDNDSAREKEKQFEKLRYLIGRSAKGTIADIDVLGFDAIIIDEAHNFRNVFSYVPAQEGTKRYSLNGQTSGRAQLAFMLCNYIQTKHGGNIVLLTATPFNNSPLEVYSMLSLIALNKMEKAGISSITEFMETFIQETAEYVVSSTNKLTQRPVVKSFQNKRSLQSLVFNYINFKSGEDAGVRRPVKINLPRLSFKDANGNTVQLPPKEQIVTYLKMNEMQEMYQKEAIRVAESGKGLKERGANTLRGMSLSRKNAFSPFMVSKEEPEDFEDFVINSPKILYTMECIKSVQAHHKKTNTPLSGQVIYSNIGKDYFPLIKEYLEKRLGFKTGVTFNNRKFDEVEMITGGGNADKKEAIKDAFLAGVVKVVIGSSTIREGIDLQKRGSVLYNLYPDFNPTDVRQLEGRIWRQGNWFGYVRVVMPLVQNSMDVFIFQKLEEKSARINDIWSKADDDTNVLDQESLNPEAIKYALFTDLNKLTGLRIEEIRKDISKSKVKLENELDTLLKINAAQSVAEESKKRVLEKVYSLKLKLIDFLELHRKTESKDKDFKKKIDKYKKLVDSINDFDGVDNKALVKLGIKIQKMDDHSYSYFVYQSSDRLGLFRASLTVINQSADIVARYDNLEQAISSIKNSLRKQQAELEETATPEYQIKIWAEIRDEKKKLNITGRYPQEAAKDFASLNYLLNYKMADVDDVNGNPLPTDKPKSAKSVKLIPPTENKTKIKLKMKAKALQLRRKRALALLKLAS